MGLGRIISELLRRLCFGEADAAEASPFADGTATDPVAVNEIDQLEFQECSNILPRQRGAMRNVNSD